MTKPKRKPTFIPYRRADVIRMCLEDGKLSQEQKGQFQTFCDILTAYYHFSFHAILERMKDYFFHLDPDSPFKKYGDSSKENTEQEKEAFFNDFQNLLEKANFHPLSEEDLTQSFLDQSLIHLNTDVDFDDFERYLFYYRGVKQTAATVKHLKLWKKEITFDTLSRVVLVAQFKKPEYFQQKKKKRRKIQFVPGRTYMYFFKNIPKADLEIIFPNVNISMTLKDKLLFLIPLFGAGLGTLFKMATKLLILIGFILLTLGMTSYLEKLGIDPDHIPNQLTALIAVVAPIIIILGGFAIKQYTNYKNKWIEFLDGVTQNLFFKSISINAGVFQSLIDAAEEEECKEAILAYYHILTSGKKMNKEELDAYIETWFREKFETDINFDVEDALEKLRCLKDTLHIDGKLQESCLLERNSDGTLQVLPLSQTLLLLDTIWDDIFQFNQCKAFDL